MKKTIKMPEGREGGEEGGADDGKELVYVACAEQKEREMGCLALANSPTLSPFSCTGLMRHSCDRIGTRNK